MKKKIADLNCKIKFHFFGKLKFKVRKGIIIGNSKSLWHAVKIAKNIGNSTIPSNMTLNNVPIKTDQISEQFAEFFVNKVGHIVRETVVNPRVYNGIRKIHAESSMFMTRNMILECVDGLKLKNTEGYDRTP